MCRCLKKVESHWCTVLPGYRKGLQPIADSTVVDYWSLLIVIRLLFLLELSAVTDKSHWFKSHLQTIQYVPVAYPADQFSIIQLPLEIGAKEPIDYPWTPQHQTQRITLGSRRYYLNPERQATYGVSWWVTVPVVSSWLYYSYVTLASVVKNAPWRLKIFL